jgi:hypothetical protein
MSALDDALYYGRQCIGAAYGWWGGGALEAWAPMFTNAPGLTPDYVLGSSANCAGIINAATNMGTGNPDQYWGTLAWADYMSESFDVSRWYKVGTIILEPFGGGSEGHVVIVSTPSQYCLQSNTVWGVTESVQTAGQHVYTPFYYAGWHPSLPDSSQFPGGAGGKSLSVTGYPGNVSTPREWAHWAGRVASEIYGIPPTLPVMVMVEEWAGGGTGPMYMDADTTNDISSYPGYLYPVDYDSTGWFQQRYIYFGDASNAEHALRMFLDGALDVAPDGPPYPQDRDSIAEWAYRTQRSGDPEWFASHWDRVLELLDGYVPPGPTPPPIPTPEEIVYEPIVLVVAPDREEDKAYADALHLVLDSVDVANGVHDEPKNIEGASKAALSGKADAPTVLIIGSGAEDLLYADAKGLKDSHLWRVFIKSGIEPEPVSTLRGVRKVVIPHFKEKALLAKFDAVLVALDNKYTDLIAQSDKDGPLPEPPPAPPAPEHYQERGWVRTSYGDEKRLRFEPESSNYADPWFELVKLAEVSDEDLLIKLRRQ